MADRETKNRGGFVGDSLTTAHTERKISQYSETTAHIEKKIVTVATNLQPESSGNADEKK